MFYVSMSRYTIGCYSISKYSVVTSGFVTLTCVSFGHRGEDAALKTSELKPKPADLGLMFRV